MHLSYVKGIGMKRGYSLKMLQFRSIDSFIVIQTVFIRHFNSRVKSSGSTQSNQARTHTQLPSQLRSAKMCLTAYHNVPLLSVHIPVATRLAAHALTTKEAICANIATRSTQSFVHPALTAVSSWWTTNIRWLQLMKLSLDLLSSLQPGWKMKEVKVLLYYIYVIPTQLKIYSISGVCWKREAV